MHSHPLVIDYIKSESRGKATALQALGNGVGEGFAMIVLITIQMHTSAQAATIICGGIVLVMSVIVIFMIREPVLKTKKSQSLPIK